MESRSRGQVFKARELEEEIEMKLPLAKDGALLIKVFLIFTVASYVLTRLHWFFYLVLAVFFIATLFLVVFFRDPERDVKIDRNLVLSPADGTVLNIKKAGESQTVEIFMNPLNVHVQRSPVSGVVKSVQYKAGAFLPAYVPKASELNEKNRILIEGTEGAGIEVVQIAGIMVRRIVSYVKQGDSVAQGQRIGMIKFGSQVDITLPGNMNIKVKEKDKVKAGITVIASV